MRTAHINRRLVLSATAAVVGGAVAPVAAHAEEAVRLDEYWAAKQRNGSEIKLAMYRKRVATPLGRCCSSCTARQCLRGPASICQCRAMATIPPWMCSPAMASMSGQWTTKAMASRRAPTATPTSPAALRT
jgi:hypothetical protein